MIDLCMSIICRGLDEQEFVLCVDKVVLRSEEREREEKKKEQHWWDHWNHSLNSLTQLYS